MVHFLYALCNNGVKIWKIRYKINISKRIGMWFEPVLHCQHDNDMLPCTPAANISYCTNNSRSPVEEFDIGFQDKATTLHTAKCHNLQTMSSPEVINDSFLLYRSTWFAKGSGLPLFILTGYGHCYNSHCYKTFNICIPSTEHINDDSPGFSKITYCIILRQGCTFRFNSV